MTTLPHRRRARRAGLAMAVACAGGIAAGALHAAADHHDGAASPQVAAPPLLERPGCTGQRPAPPAVATGAVVPLVARGPDVAASATQIVTVRVPPTAILRIDEHGEVVEAMTNTGCAPRPTDDVFLVRPDGTLAAAATTAPASRSWVGDFRQAGAFVRQR